MATQTKADFSSFKDKVIVNGKIYVLQDPFTNEIRYVGKYEGKYLSVRLANHVNSVKKNTKNHRTDWIRSVGRPIISLIQDGYTSRKELCEAEMFLIQFYKDIGLNLVNSTNGGFGHLAPLSDEHKRKISQGNLGRQVSQETRKKIGLANSISNKGKIPWNKGMKIGPFSDSTKQKMSMSRKGNKNACKNK